MNLFQMSGKTLTSFNNGRAADNKGRVHLSIHPFGRSDAYRKKQRERRASSFSGE